MAATYRLLIALDDISGQYMSESTLLSELYDYVDDHIKDVEGISGSIDFVRLNYFGSKDDGQTSSDKTRLEIFGLAITGLPTTVCQAIMDLCNDGENTIDAAVTSWICFRC